MNYVVPLQFQKDSEAPNKERAELITGFIKPTLVAIIPWRGTRTTRGSRVVLCVRPRIIRCTSTLLYKIFAKVSTVHASGDSQ